MTRQLSDEDISGAFRELSLAVAQLAGEAGVPSSTRQAALSDAQELEISRLQLSHPRMLRQETSFYPEGDFRETSASEEILRLTATFPREFGPQPPRHGAGVSRRGSGRPGARVRRDSDTLALSAASSGGGATLVSKWGLPVTVAGVPVTTENSQRLGLGRVLPPLVTDVSDDPSMIDTDVVGTLRRRGGGLGDGYDQPPDLGSDVSGFGDQTVEYLNQGAVSQPEAEISRLVQAGADAGLPGLRTGAAKNRHPATGRFVPKARLTGTLSGPV